MTKNEAVSKLIALEAENEGLREQLRIIEEHCADRNALQVERDRLKGELDASKFRNDALEGLVDTERQSRKETENTLFFVRKELQKNKGELAEARRLLRDARGHLVSAAGIIADETDADEEDISDEFEFVATIDKFLAAATPAEQAQPTFTQADADALAAEMDAADSIPAEQAHREAASPGMVSDAFLAGVARGEANADELAKRVEALDKHVRERLEAIEQRTAAYPKWSGATLADWRDRNNAAPAPPPPEAAVQFTGVCRVCGELVSDGREVHRECEAAGPMCRKLILSLGSLCTRRLHHGGDCEHDTREVAGPGHVCTNCGGTGVLSIGSHGAIKLPCSVCSGSGSVRAVHAVPKAHAPEQHVFLPPPDDADWCDANVKRNGYLACGRRRTDPIHLGCALISCKRHGCRGEQDHVTGCADNPVHAVPPIPEGT